MRAVKKNKGFTLVELVLVIIIIGILAALAIPQFTSSTDDAREATVKSNLAVLRNAIQLYYHEHDNEYPPHASFAAVLTGYTNKDHTVNPAGAQIPDPAYPYGPYLVAVPDNPAVDTNPAAVNDEPVADHGTVVAAGGGWNYDEDTGQIHANSAGHLTL